MSSLSTLTRQIKSIEKRIGQDLIIWSRLSTIDQFIKLVFVIDKEHLQQKFVTFEFQRDEEDEDGNEIYVWYNETIKSWLLSDGSHFQARNNLCYMYIKSQGKQELRIHLQ